MSASLQWLQNHQALLWWAGALSFCAFAGTLIAVPLLIIRLPADYFTGATRRERRPAFRHPALRWMGLVAKNMIGGILILAGIAMLVLPGQGLLTILIGVSLVDFPGKYALEKRLVAAPAVHRTVNWIRARGRRPPIRIR